MGYLSSKFPRFILKIVLILIIFCLFFTFIPKFNHIANASNDSSYIVMNAKNYEVIDGDNIHLQLPMASTTKTMTALIVCENCLPDAIISIPKEAVGIEGSSVYLKEGDVFTVKELLYGLMLRSGNDAAVALAIFTAGSIDNFASLMNYKAEELGLCDTHFVNPHGLHDKNHYTSAYDLCKLGCYAMRNPLFKEIVGTKSISVGSDDNKRFWANKNKILNNYHGGNGIKTGFTKDAGRCLIASATRNDVTVVSVVLNRYNMFRECELLMDKAFAKLL